MENKNTVEKKVESISVESTSKKQMENRLKQYEQKFSEKKTK